MNKSTKIYCRAIKDIPSVDHFAIITESTYYTAADQRSIDCPGHGYPASSADYVEYCAFLSEEEWKEEINTLSTRRYGSKNFKAIVVKVPTVTTKIEVTIK